MSVPVRSKPLDLMPNSFTTPTLLRPPQDSKGLGNAKPDSSKPAAKPKAKAKQQSTKPPKAKTATQEAKGVSWILYTYIHGLDSMF